MFQLRKLKSHVLGVSRTSTFKEPEGLRGQRRIWRVTHKTEKEPSSQKGVHHAKCCRGRQSDTVKLFLSMFSKIQGVS